MSDAKTPPDGGPQDSAPSDETPPDQPPPDHVPTGETPSVEPPSDHVPTDETPSDEPPQDHVPTDETPSDEPPPDHVAADKPSSSEQPSEREPLDQPPLDHVPPESDSEPQSRVSEIGEHLKSRDSWQRLLFMVLFVVLFIISRFVVFAVMILQILFLLLSGKRNDRLAGFGASLAVYSLELVAYLTLASERQPFPFTDWPDGSLPSEQADTE